MQARFKRQRAATQTCNNSTRPPRCVCFVSVSPALPALKPSIFLKTLVLSVFLPLLPLLSAFPCCCCDFFSYDELTSFVRAVKAAGVDHVIVHARKCLLNGLSTSANRTVPPLRYDVVHRLALEFPELEIVLNGGINDLAAVNDHIRGTAEWGGYGGGVAGVMVGRAAYYDPWTFRHTDSAVFGSTDPGASLV